MDSTREETLLSHGFLRLRSKTFPRSGITTSPDETLHSTLFPFSMVAVAVAKTHNANPTARNVFSLL